MRATYLGHRVGWAAFSLRRAGLAESPQELDKCARQWVHNKFCDGKKADLRNQLWPGINWEFRFIHARVERPRELEVSAAEGVTLHAFHDVLAKLAERKAGSFSASAGGDLAEIVSYYRSFDKQ